MSRRTRGEGSIHRRVDGRWAATISLGWGVTAAGMPRRVRRTFYGKTKDEVARQLREALASVDHGRPVAFSRLTVAQFLDQWLKDKRPTIAASTYDGYEHLLRMHVKPDLGHIKLAKLTPQEVQAWMTRLGERPSRPHRPGGPPGPPLSARTIRYAHAVLRHALNMALQFGMVARNAAVAAKPPRLSNGAIEPLTPSQALQLLSASDEAGDRFVHLYTVAIAEGLRQGELLGLKWRDIDWDAGQLRIVRTLQAVDGRPGFVEPKTHRSRRAIQLSRTGLEALRAQRELQARERAIAGTHWHKDIPLEFRDLIFTNLRGGPLGGSHVTKAFQRRLEETGLPKQRFHDLRHATATFLLAQGVPMKVVSEKMGHAQIGITMNLYSHVTLAMQQEAADRIDQVLGQRRPGLRVVSKWSEAPSS